MHKTVTMLSTILKFQQKKNYVYQKKLLGHENAWDFLIVSGWNDRKNISSQYQ